MNYEPREMAKNRSDSVRRSGIHLSISRAARALPRTDRYIAPARSGPTYRRTSAAMRTATMMLTTIQTSRTTCACDLIFALSCDQSNKFMTLDHFYYLNFLGLLFFSTSPSNFFLSASRCLSFASPPKSARCRSALTPRRAPLTSAKSRLLSESFGE